MKYHSSLSFAATLFFVALTASACTEHSPSGSIPKPNLENRSNTTRTAPERTGSVGENKENTLQQIRDKAGQHTDDILNASSAAYSATVEGLRAYFAAATATATAGVRTGEITQQELQSVVQLSSEGNAHLAASVSAIDASSGWTNTAQVELAMRELATAGEIAYDVQSIVGLPLPVELENLPLP